MWDSRWAVLVSLLLTVAAGCRTAPHLDAGALRHDSHTEPPASRGAHSEALDASVAGAGTPETRGRELTDIAGSWVAQSGPYVWRMRVERLESGRYFVEIEPGDGRHIYRFGDYDGDGALQLDAPIRGFGSGAVDLIAASFVDGELHLSHPSEFRLATADASRMGWTATTRDVSYRRANQVE